MRTFEMKPQEPCLCGDPQCLRCFPVSDLKYLSDMSKQQLARIIHTAKICFEFSELDSLLDQEIDAELYAEAIAATLALRRAVNEYFGED